VKAGVRKFGSADRRLLPEGRLAGPMPWVIAIMMFLTLLAAAAGLRLGSAASHLGEDIGNRVTVQIVEPNPDLRESQTRAAVAALQRLPGISSVRRLEPAEMKRLLEPWLGSGGLDSDIPVPAMIDVSLVEASRESLASLKTAVAAAAPSARVDENGQWLEPVARLIGSLKWLSAALVLLMIGATAATVVLAARASLDTHRSTIEVLHLMGATDVQVARLFQRRIALDALFGGCIGLLAAALVLLVIGNRIAALGSELLGVSEMPFAGWFILFALPILGVLRATLVARLTILRALGRML
jgi:cell division transport system permease protein